MEKGQTVKTNAQLTEEGYTQGVLLPKKNADSESFEGAYVLDIVPGSHDTVVCVDFGSLYPSIMITNSICPTTIVNDPRYLNLPGVEYITITWQKRIWTKRLGSAVLQTFSNVTAALTQFCYDDIKMQLLLKTASALTHKDELTSNFLESINKPNHPLIEIKDVLSALKKSQLGKSERMLKLLIDIRARYKDCRTEFECMLDIECDDDIEEDDDDDDYWTKLAAKRSKQKIVFSNKKKSK